VKTVALGDIATWGSGGTPSRSVREYFGNGIPWLSIADLNDGPVGEAKESLTELGLKNSSAKIVPTGTLLVAMYGSIGKLGIATRELCTSQAIAFAIPNPNCVHTRYLFHFLLTERRSLLALGRGGTQSNIGQGDLKAWKMPLLPLAEQRRIAEVLDRADALRAKRRAALAQLDSLTQAIFLDIFGDPAANTTGWNCVELADAVTGKYGVKAGPFGSSLKKEDYATSGYRIYGQEQVIAGRFDIGDYYIDERKYQQLKSCAVAAGDLLVSLVGSFGKVLVVPSGIQPGIINPRLLKITPDKNLLSSVFLSYLLTQPSVQAALGRQAHGGTMGILNAGLLKTLKVILPPLALQQAFALHISAIEALKTNHRAALGEVDALFASLQHRAFRGEL
jgi:type I restriction enzyme S subunit